MKRDANYEKNPFVLVKETNLNTFQGYEKIIEEIKMSSKNMKIVTLDYYHGVDEKEVFENLISKLNFSKIYDISKIKKTEDEIFKLIERSITSDRVFGVLSNHIDIEEFFQKGKLKEIRKEIENSNEEGVLVYGVGASLIKSDLIIYFDMARWEIQKRFRENSLDNWGAENFNEDILRKYKRAFFIEWRVLDNHKKKLFDKIDYLVDTNKKNNPKMITGNLFREGLNHAVTTPFRLVPFFDPGVWGGQWMKEVCDLDRTKENYAWCFDCVPEENSLNLKYGDVIVEIPSIDLVFYKAKELLGEKVHARFGTEFPIRFDFLDTMGGQHLSLQVHPLTEYIQEKFGMHYTQDESYYILDAGEDAVVYLGVKTGINSEEMIEDLIQAEKGIKPFDDSKFINKFSAKKHDHFLIPAGTVHCSGKNSMVLEVSSTPYIFTFKLWDWERVGMDGVPRPVHIEHGKENIQFDRDTQWVKKNIINRVEILKEEDGHLEERTGLHEREFIETRRDWFSKRIKHNTEGNLNVINLIEGDEAIIESPEEKFKPYIVHYAETFVIPASIGEYTIRPYGKSEGKKIATLKASVRV